MNKKYVLIVSSLIIAVAFILTSCGGTGTYSETTASTVSATSKSYNSYNSYNSYDSNDYDDSYGYDSDDKYYSANDYDNDGELNGNEFQGAVNDYMDDYFGSYDSHDSYDSYGGEYGYGEQYDRDVNSIADAFGEDPDYVNDVFGALADEMY